MSNKFVQVVKKMHAQRKMNKQSGRSTLAKKQRDVMADCRTILENQGLLDLYEARPYDQQQSYAKWIAAPKRDTERQRRIIIMVEELRAGVYMSVKPKD